MLTVIGFINNTSAILGTMVFSFIFLLLYWYVSKLLLEKHHKKYIFFLLLNFWLLRLLGILSLGFGFVSLFYFENKIPAFLMISWGTFLFLLFSYLLKKIKTIEFKKLRISNLKREIAEEPRDTVDLKTEFTLKNIIKPKILLISILMLAIIHILGGSISYYFCNMQPGKKIYFPDKNLSMAIKNYLKKPSDKPLYVSDIYHLRVLKISQKNISDLTGLEYFENLIELNLSRNNISDISPLKNLKYMRKLNLFSNKIKDISPLRNLIRLKELNMGENLISDISPLDNLKNLKILWLRKNKIFHINALANLKKLKALDLGHNAAIQNIESTSKLLRLQSLHLNETGITDLIPLQNLLLLKELDLSNNYIIDISVLTDMTRLKKLWLHGNHIRDIGALRNLRELEALALFNNSIKDISPLKSLTKLTFINMRTNQVANIEPLRGLINLKSLNLRDNPIQDISPLIENSKRGGLINNGKLWLGKNKLNLEDETLKRQIETLEKRGCNVYFKDSNEGFIFH